MSNTMLYDMFVACLKKELILVVQMNLFDSYIKSLVGPNRISNSSMKTNLFLVETENKIFDHLPDCRPLNASSRMYLIPLSKYLHFQAHQASIEMCVEGGVLEMYSISDYN